MLLFEKANQKINNTGNWALIPFIVTVVMLFCVSGFSLNLHAGEVDKTDVKYSNGTFFLDFNALIDARYETVHTVVTDYDRLHELSDAVLESVVLGTPRPREKRVRFLAQVCLLVFCFKKSLVVDVIEDPEGVFSARVVPELCDFNAGHGTWRFSAADALHTRVQYLGEHSPAFWIPPVIGPYLIKRKLIREAMETIQKVETITANA